LYPFIELLTACLLTLAVHLLATPYIGAYLLFFSALIVTIRTDLETFMISRFMTLFLMPVGFGAAALGYLPLTLSQSFLGAASGYFFLSAVSWLYYSFTKRIGLGQGDVELLGMIGAFIGATGWWISLMLGSLGGSIIGTAALTVVRPRTDKIKIPFGPFLALGAIAYVFCAPFLTRLFLGN
jgi:leader peptidase (prepilin peptidase)/N-methyltransferase